MRSIKDLKNVKGKTALVRVDFNVPIKNGKVEDDFRIRKALPTINFLLKKGVKIILITHLGKDGTASLTPVIDRFFKISKFKKDKVSFLENIRKFSGEEKNDPSFARGLSRQADFYVNDAFSVSHRAHGSIVGLPKFLPSYAGFQLEEEVKNLSKVLKPKSARHGHSGGHPFLFILGGAKFSTKLPLIKKFLKLADNVFIGGALLNDFLKAEGLDVGKSLVDHSVASVKKLLKNKKIILPDEVLVSSRRGIVNKKDENIKKDETILDIGKDSGHIIEPYIKKAKLILWNGPLGKYEMGGDKETKIILKMLAKSKAETIIGGGDTVEPIDKMHLQNKFSFVSTGGGATLDFLANGTLPGIKALK